MGVGAVSSPVELVGERASTADVTVSVQADSSSSVR